MAIRSSAIAMAARVVEVPARGYGAALLGGIAAAHCQHRVGIGEREELVGFEEDVFRRQQGALGVVLQEAVALLGVGPEALDGFVHLAVQGQAGLGA